MKYSLIVLLTLTCFVVQAQTPAIPASGKTTEAFIPKGWTLVANTAEDFNKDKLVDAAIVIQYDKKGTISDYICRSEYYPLALFIVLKQADGSYKLSTVTQKKFGSNDCMQFLELGKRSGTLKVTMADMSINGTSLEHQFFFRFQQNDWYLIGYKSEMAKNAGMDMGIWGTDKNLVTGVTEEYRLKIDPNSEVMDGPREVTKKTKSKPKPLAKLADFDFDNTPLAGD